MKRILFLAAILGAVTFWTSCNKEQTETQQEQPLVTSNGQTIPPDDLYWAKNNFDLQRVGDLVQRSHSPEEFERYLNRPGGINNLDLNGDGYVDYVSVREFNDLNDPYCRGLSMYTQYGPDQIQDIGDVLFYRDEPQYQGARILLRGDPRIYGDNYYYQNNWLDQSMQLVSFLFGGDRDLYSTPYYYDNYPTWYETYDVVETPAYQQRVVALYPQPVVIYTTQPEFISKIDIRSPYDGRYYSQAHAMFVKPAREQEEFIKQNPRPDKNVRAENNGRRNEGKPENGNPNNGKPDRAGSQTRGERPNGQPDRGQQRQDQSRGQRPKIARNEHPGRGHANNPGNRGHANNPAPARSAPANRPNKSPGGGGNKGNGGNSGNGGNHGNGGKKAGGGNKGGGKPGGGGGGNKGGGKKH